MINQSIYSFIKHCMVIVNVQCINCVYLFIFCFSLNVLVCYHLMVK